MASKTATCIGGTEVNATGYFILRALRKHLVAPSDDVQLFVGGVSDASVIEVIAINEDGGANGHADSKK
jgi:hypothetical protein